MPGLGQTRLSGTTAHSLPQHLGNQTPWWRADGSLECQQPTYAVQQIAVYVLWRAPEMQAAGIMPRMQR